MQIIKSRPITKPVEVKERAVYIANTIVETFESVGGRSTADRLRRVQTSIADRIAQLEAVDPPEEAPDRVSKPTPIDIRCSSAELAMLITAMASGEYGMALVWAERAGEFSSDYIVRVDGDDRDRCVAMLEAFERFNS